MLEIEKLEAVETPSDASYWYGVGVGLFIVGGIVLT